ncbi:MAG: alpha-amylase family glycosyl hydrolase [Acholeplasmataceae bacterium]|jgi:alpha-amylase
MKRILKFILIILFTFSLVACDKQSNIEIFSYQETMEQDYLQIIDLELLNINLDEIVIEFDSDFVNAELTDDGDVKVFSKNKKGITSITIIYGDINRKIEIEILPTLREKAIETLDLKYTKYNNFYQIFVRSFADSDGDGIGDLNGITENLNYLHSLGVTALWLTPIHPTISYHGYEVIDYYEVNPEFGTIQDLKDLIESANSYGIDIVLDMVFNHTSTENEWFTDSTTRDKYYIKHGNSYYETFPFSRDLNLKNEELKEELSNILLYYLDMGISGFRFDAIKHFFTKDKMPSYDSSPDISMGLFLRGLKTRVKKSYPEAYFVGEYFEYNHQRYRYGFLGLDSLFNFEIAGMLREETGTFSDLNRRLPRIYNNFDSYSESNYVDAPFVNNHDLDRLASIMPSLTNRKMAYSILLTLPGSPFIYYGDELGMTGRRASGIGRTVTGYKGVAYDEFVREPFPWKNKYQTTWFPISYENQNVESPTQALNNEDSLLNHIKTLNNIRLNYPALMYGNYFEVFPTETPMLMGYVRMIQHEDFIEKVVVVHNLTNRAYTLDINSIDIFGSKELNVMETYIGLLDVIEKE